MASPTLDVVGIGNAIVDIIAHADDDFLITHSMAKGGMALIDEARTRAIYAAMGPAVRVSGGSAGNTIAGIASLGGKAGYIGKVRNDEVGNSFRHDIEAAGVVFPTAPATDGPASACCYILVTPDGQRTMNTYLGACVNLSSADIDAGLIERAAYTYLEGYLFDPPHAQEAFRTAAAIAHGAGRKVSLSLSDAFCVHRHRDAFLTLVDHHVDLVFANESEILALMETDSFETAIDRLRPLTDCAAITRGAAGSVVVTPDAVITVAASPVAHVVDTTGAGDLYAAGFLYGLTHGYDLAGCGRLGSLCAAEIISHYGARPEADLKSFL